MTLKELSEHPEQASEEDVKAMEETMNAIREIGDQSNYVLNGVTSNSGRSQEELSKSYYEETMLMAAVLESFVYSPKQEYKDIKSLCSTIQTKVSSGKCLSRDTTCIW